MDDGIEHLFPSVGEVLGERLLQGPGHCLLDRGRHYPLCGRLADVRPSAHGAHSSGHAFGFSLCLLLDLVFFENSFLIDKQANGIRLRPIYIILATQTQPYKLPRSCLQSILNRVNLGLCEEEN
jgi:hypothetical protein